MPIPRSLTVKVTRPFCTEIYNSTASPWGEYLMALESKLPRICSNKFLSKIAVIFS